MPACQQSPTDRKLRSQAKLLLSLVFPSPSAPPSGPSQALFDLVPLALNLVHIMQHPKLMDIALWSGLSEELQELVFARLPWPQIYRVRILSKGWNQKLMGGAQDSQFRRACASAQPKSFALLALGAREPGLLLVNMFDLASNRWHTFETSLACDPHGGEIEVVSASDGGLVCFLSKAQSKSKETPRLLSVCNPLTRVWKQLPPLYGMDEQKIMVQLIMDRETKHYRVIVVGYSKDPQVGNLVNVYHSESRQWTKADASPSAGEVVWGYLYNFNSLGGISGYLFSFASGWLKPCPCSYNFADGLVHEIGSKLRANFVHDSVLVKDHLFRLKDREILGGLETQCVEEYQAVDCGASLTLSTEYPLTRLPSNPYIRPDDLSWFPDFLACKDFLLLFVFNELGEENCREFLFIYEFSAEEWRELPTMPGGNDMFFSMEQMCELRFDAVP